MESMNYGTFYGVGVGPGDPELMTLKAVKTLEACSVLAVPQTMSGEMTAYSIARQAASLENKELVPLRFTMSRDKKVQHQAHVTAAAAVRAYLERGVDVAMPILGDVSVFSTYCYLMDILKEEGYPCVMIPGVPSFCAVAAHLGKSLTTMNEPLHIIPGGGNETNMEILDMPGSKVLMKSGKNLGTVLDELDKRSLLEHSSMIQNCGMPGEKVYETLKDKPVTDGYFVTLIVPGE